MVIRVQNIPEEGMDVEFSIPPAQMKNGIPEDDEVLQVFAHEVDCQFHLDLNKKDVYLSGEAGTSIHAICGRCGKEFDQPMNVDISLTCSPGSAPKGSNVYQEADEGLVFYRHSELDLTEIVREQLLLSLPIQYFCQESCKGLCPHCGANLNEENPHECGKKETLN
jgi:uncharacterized metal-binding protein YceD (DUF177 family)